MRHHRSIVVAALIAASCSIPALAGAEGHVSVGAILWRHSTPLQVRSATDFDGSSMTAGERAKSWDIEGSGVGARLTYELPRLLTIYGEAGTSQATVSDKDVTSPGQSVETRGMNGGAFYGLGVQIGDYFTPTSNLFWRVGGSVSVLATGLDQDVTTSWDYDETKLGFDAKIGGWVDQVGFYGGVRMVHASADLKENDRSNLPGFQTRTTELERDGSVDLLVGAQTRGSDVSGFAELGMVGTFSATAGLTMRF
ncbi:MAG TPA: hypothetical protein VJY35_05915 [Candidatus Eisenbacteria bacterium]|nr:hypothetical protein [Candidatus Eisenbacteria bacterium]